MKSPLTPWQKAHLAELVSNERRFGAFLEALHGGWRDSNGKPFANPNDAVKRLLDEIRTMKTCLDKAERDLVSTWVEEPV